MSNLLKADSAKFGSVRTIVNDDGSISINAEDAATGFGWYQIKNGREYIKWERVNAYIKELGYSITAGKDDYIPESLFYLLAMKANNDTAQEFKKWIAVEVLPQIRKKGVYVSEISDDDSSMTYNYDEVYESSNNGSLADSVTGSSSESLSVSPMNIATGNLSPELKAIFCIDKRTVEMDTRIGSLENNMTIDYGQQEEIRSLVVKKVVETLGGKNTPAYKELAKKAFCSIWKDYKRIMNVNSYRNTPTIKYDYALRMLNAWKPDNELKLMIKGANTALNASEVYN